MAQQTSTNDPMIGTWKLNVRAADFGLQNEYGVHDEFMVLPLHEGALHGVSGMVKYLPEFWGSWLLAIRHQHQIRLTDVQAC